MFIYGKNAAIESLKVNKNIKKINEDNLNSNLSIKNIKKYLY